ncbi:MAG TPA: enoyl-CoA hydratase/isomerase family protein [Steroidobacteraceae bacterium]|nr:enoyl-CoA hydratase/isomerase family protein [Steroidobacteraceae bacterium]
MDDFVLREHAGAVATLTLNRPAALNAVYGEVFRQLLAHIAAVDADTSIRVMVLAGAGRAFCAGGDKNIDIGASASWTAEQRRAEEELAQSAVQALRKLRVPVIARVHGVAVGAGCDLALACDLIVASEPAQFGQFWVRRGLVPDLGAIYTLPRLIGLHRAKELILTGRLIDAQTAAQMGLVNEVVPPAQLDAAVARVCAELAALPPAAVAMAKQLLNTSFERDFETLLDLVKLGNMHLTETADFKTAVAAWLAADASKSAQSAQSRRE